MGGVAYSLDNVCAGARCIITGSNGDASGTFYSDVTACKAKIELACA